MLLALIWKGTHLEYTKESLGLQSEISIKGLQRKKPSRDTVPWPTNENKNHY